MRRAALATIPSRRQTAAWLVGLALAAALPAAAEDPVEETAAADRQAVKDVTQTGLRAFIDPDTGELTSTPTRRQIEELQQAIRQQAMADFDGPLSRSGLGLEPFELATGGRGVYLRGRFQSALVVHRLDGGELELVCRGDASATEHEHPATAPVTEWAEK